MDLRTTHDWSTDVDAVHVAAVRRRAAAEPAEVLHLLLEVLEHPVDEAVHGATTRIQVEVGEDGSICVRDDGRGTDVRLDEHGRPVTKPVMATPDLRFFGRSDAPRLADGGRREGMSVVTACSRWLVHVNRRADGAWQRRYEQGLPAGAAEVLEPDGTTGTSVHLLPDPSLVTGDLDLDALRSMLASVRTGASIELRTP